MYWRKDTDRRTSRPSRLVDGQIDEEIEQHTQTNRRSRTTQYINKVVSENEWRLVTIDHSTGGSLHVAEEVPEVDVKEMAILLDHHIVVVTICDAEHVSRDAAACTRA